MSHRIASHRSATPSEAPQASGPRPRTSPARSALAAPSGSRIHLVISPWMNSSYLLSPALSSSHFAFVNALEAATSSAQLSETCRTEVARIKARLAKGKLPTVRPPLSKSPAPSPLQAHLQLWTRPTSQSTVVEALVILMLIATVRADVTGGRRDDLDFAQIHALNLAEGGKTLQERRKGEF